MRGLIGFILLACTGMAHASVTAAWKLAIEARIPHHESDGRVRTYVVRTEDIVRCHLSRAGKSVNVNPQDLTPFMLKLPAPHGSQVHAEEIGQLLVRRPSRHSLRA